MQNLIADLKIEIDLAAERYALIQARIKSRISEENDNKEPTVDKDGRFHAPCDGYTWDDVTYGGGQYLHLTNEQIDEINYQREMLGLNPIGQSGGSSFVPKRRIQANPQFAEQLKELLGKSAEVTCGKCWNDGADCYIYIKTSRKAVLDFIGNYSENQERVKAEEKARIAAEQKASKGVAPTGRQTVRARLVKIDLSEGFYGSTWKMFLVTENGSTVWGTCPNNIYSSDIGKTVEFTATFEHAEDDVTHAFFKRPAKATVLETEPTGV
jgi:hypothetical protein